MLNTSNIPITGKLIQWMDRENSVRLENKDIQATFYKVFSLMFFLLTDTTIGELGGRKDI